MEVHKSHWYDSTNCLLYCWFRIKLSVKRPTWKWHFVMYYSISILYIMRIMNQGIRYEVSAAKIQAKAILPFRIFAESKLCCQQKFVILYQGNLHKWTQLSLFFFFKPNTIARSKKLKNVFSVLGLTPPPPALYED